MLRFLPDDVRSKANHLYGDASEKSVLKAWFTDGTFAMVIYRCMQSAQRRRLVPLSMLFNKINSLIARAVIGRGAEFGKNFVIIHSHGIVINSSVRGGDNISIEHQVTIGEEKGATPILGDNIFIGAGAKIIGGVYIGSGARIGANAVVINDVPAGATAVGVPARIIMREQETDPA